MLEGFQLDDHLHRQFHQKKYTLCELLENAYQIRRIFCWSSQYQKQL